MKSFLNHVWTNLADSNHDSHGYHITRAFTTDRQFYLGMLSYIEEKYDATVRLFSFSTFIYYPYFKYRCLLYLPISRLSGNASTPTSFLAGLVRPRFSHPRSLPSFRSLHTACDICLHHIWVITSPQFTAADKQHAEQQREAHLRDKDARYRIFEEAEKRAQARPNEECSLVSDGMSCAHFHPSFRKLTTAHPLSGQLPSL